MKHKFDRIVVENRWAMPKYRRSSDWLILGISRWWFSPNLYEYRIGFFGITVRIWMEKVITEKPANKGK